MNNKHFNQSEEIKHNEKYKDALFRYLCNEEQEASKLYQAITGKYIPPENIELENLDSLVISDWYNDVSFKTKDNHVIILCEQQSTKCSNMTLRCLVYYTNLIRKLYEENRDGFKDKLYRSTILKIPKPEFYILYIGKEKIKCEELFTEHNAGYENINGFTNDIFLQIRVKNIDIHYNKLTETQKRASHTLAGYSYIIQQYDIHEKELKNSISDDNVRKNKAMLMAIEDCRNVGYLLDYLDRKEFKVMLEKEYTMADYIASLKEDMKKQAENIRKQALEEGMEEGIKEGIKEGIEEGMEREREYSIKNLIISYKEDDFNREKIAIKIIKLYHVTSEMAEEYLKKYFD